MFRKIQVWSRLFTIAKLPSILCTSFVLLVVIDNPSKSSEEIVPNETSNSIVASQTEVLPGHLEHERRSLLTRIRQAETKGVGIKTYLAAFQELEKMVNAEESMEAIKLRVTSIERAFEEQLRHQKSFQSKHILTNSQHKLLDLQKARLYMLSQVNRERAKYDMQPLTLDAIATKAAQTHSDEMAIIGFHSHWNTNGKKPDQRYTESGGMHNASENVGISYTKPKSIIKGELIQNHFSAASLDKLHASLMNSDGHRSQILKPEHNKLGLGLSYAATSHNGWRPTRKKLSPSPGRRASLPRRRQRPSRGFNGLPDL